MRSPRGGLFSWSRTANPSAGWWLGPREGRLTSRREAVRLRAAAAASLVLLPAIGAQGRFVRRRVPLLPEAGGPREGRVEGAEPALRLLVVGESTAAGIGAEHHEESVGGATARGLAEATGRAVRWRVVGKGGATARSARTELLPEAGAVEADAVVVTLGVNDTLKLSGWGRWTRDLGALVDDLRARCGPVPVVVAAVPPMGRFPALPHPLRWFLGVRARMLDAAAAAFAARTEGVVHLPLPFDPATDVGPYFCRDGFHPSPRGYAVWGEALGRAAADLLRADGG